MILITYCPVVVSKENHSPSLVLETGQGDSGTTNVQEIPTWAPL